jgi:hypothetical protein
MRHASIGLAAIAGIAIGFAIDAARTPEAVAGIVPQTHPSYVTHDEQTNELTVWTITDGRATVARATRIVGTGDEAHLVETVYKLREAVADAPAK